MKDLQVNLLILQEWKSQVIHSLKMLKLIVHQASKQRMTLAVSLFVSIAMFSGCNQHRFQPAPWEAENEQSSGVNATTLPSSVNGTTLPGTTLPGRLNGTTLPGGFRGTTLPGFRGYHTAGNNSAKRLTGRRNSTPNYELKSIH